LRAPSSADRSTSARDRSEAVGATSARALSTASAKSRRQLGRIRERAQPRAERGELPVEAQRLVGLAQAFPAQLGEAPDQPALLAPVVVTRLALARVAVAGFVRLLRAAGARARHLPREQIRAALPVADGAQQPFRRRRRFLVGRGQAQHRQPGVGGVARVGADVGLFAQRRDVAQQRQTARPIGRVIERGDRQRQRFDRPPSRLQPVARGVEHRGRAGKLGERHHAHVERALRLARRLEQIGLLGQHGQARVAEQRARVLLQRRRQLARATERPQEARALAAHPRALAGRRLLQRALEHRDGADDVADSLELRRQPPAEARPARRLELVGVRRAQQIETAARRLLGRHDPRHQLLGQRQRRVRARMA
jgi:hypothetical protein